MPADFVSPNLISADFSPDEVREILGREAARRNGRDFDRVRTMDFELARETFANGTESLSGARVSLRWNDVASAPRPTPAIETVGAEL